MLSRRINFKRTSKNLVAFTSSNEQVAELNLCKPELLLNFILLAHAGFDYKVANQKSLPPIHLRHIARETREPSAVVRFFAHAEPV